MNTLWTYQCYLALCLTPLTTRENKLKLNWTVKRQSHHFRCYKVKQRPRNRYYCRGPIWWFRCLVQMCFFSSSIPLRKICTIRHPKHSLESPWSILIAHLALCLQLTAKHSVCFIAPSACLLYVPCICDIFALRKLLVPTWERYSALCDVTKRFLRLGSWGRGGLSAVQFNGRRETRRTTAFKWIFACCGTLCSFPQSITGVALEADQRRVRPYMCWTRTLHDGLTRERRLSTGGESRFGWGVNSGALLCFNSVEATVELKGRINTTW